MLPRTSDGPAGTIPAYQDQDPATFGTLRAWDGSKGCCLGTGPFAAATIGQVFTVPAGRTQLRHFAVLLHLPEMMAVTGRVHAWDGRHAVGPALFAGPPSNAGSTGFAEIGFDTGAVPLVTAQRYVLSVTAVADPGVKRQSSAFGLAGGDDADGLVYLNDHGPESHFTSAPWRIGDGSLAFAVTFG